MIKRLFLALVLGAVCVPAMAISPNHHAIIKHKAPKHPRASHATNPYLKHSKYKVKQGRHKKI
jgi:hypothetical protein